MSRAEASCEISLTYRGFMLSLGTIKETSGYLIETVLPIVPCGPFLGAGELRLVSDHLSAEILCCLFLIFSCLS